MTPHRLSPSLNFRRSGCFFFLAALLVVVAAFGRRGTLSAQSDGTPWRAIDALGRTTAIMKETGPMRENKSVGIFYFLWCCPVSGIPQAPGTDHPYNVTEILEKDPDALSKTESPLWGGNGTSHYWGEPLFGYYRSDDPWILRKHLQLLADAGIDFLVFDTTNALTYPEVFLPLCEMIKTLQAEGEKTPQVTFMLNSSAADTALTLWNQIYGTGKYDDLLFLLDGRPLMIGDPKKITHPDIRKSLTLRKAHWPFTMVNTQDAWHWEATYPQPYGWSKSPEEPEQVNVSVAQNLSRYDGLVTPMSSGRARGRSFCGGQTEPEIATDEGRNFSEQWLRALELDPPYVMITGWNEWIAGRWLQNGQYVFVDQYDREHSRDIEMMKGGHLDNYYLQMISGVRRYKGTPELPTASAPVTIEMEGDFSQWGDVTPALTDHHGETIPRDFDGNGGTHYRNDTGRNDIIETKAARDKENLYFYLKTQDPIQPENPDGLCLLLETDGRLETGWIGGDYLIGRHYAEGETSLERYDGKKKEPNVWKWRPAKLETVKYSLAGNELQICVPFSAIRLPESQKSLARVSFKWLDNVPEEMTPSDLYQTGDVAPESRFFYQVGVR